MDQSIRAAELVGALSLATDLGTGQPLEHALRTAVLAFYRTHVGPGRPPEVRERMIEAALSDPARARESFAAMCEVAQRFAAWLELSPGIGASLEYVFARWDGKGLPREVGGEELPLPSRLLHVARDFSLFLAAAGPDDARAVLER